MAIGYDLMQDETQEDTMQGKYLTFTLGKGNYAVPIRYVIEINRVLDITFVPDFPWYLEGVTNLRGRIIPIMNLRKRLGLPVIEFTDTTCFMIISVNDSPYGLIVDSISEVVSIEDEDISEPPIVEDSAVSDFILGIARVNDQIKLIVDCETILAE